MRVRQLQAAGQDVPEQLQAGFDAAEEALYKNVRGIFGGRIRQCTTGAAPIAKEILEFFYACGVPVMEGYGMTETATVATVNTPDEFRFGSVGKPIPGVEAKVAEDGELLLRGAQHLQGLLQERRGHGRHAGGRLAAHRRPREDRRRRLRVHRRAQEGHHHHRRRQEHHAGQPRERAQAEPLDIPGGGGGRPPALSRRDHHARPRGGPGLRRAARDHGRGAPGIRADARGGPEGGGRGQLEGRSRGADQEVRDPPARPDPGDGRADAHPEGQAQRGGRQARGRDRRPVRSG